MGEKDKYRKCKPSIYNSFWVERDYCSYECKNRNHCSNCPFTRKRVEEKQKQKQNNRKEKQRLRILKEDYE